MAEGSTRRTALAAGLVLAMGPLAWPAAAAVGARSPEEHVRRFAEGALATLRDASLDEKERARRLDALVAQGFDLDRIARLTLGRYGKTASAEERREFVALFKRYVLTAYGRQFDAYAGWHLRTASVAPAGEDVTVESWLEGGGGTPVRVDWRLAPAAGGWRILDLKVEGVSFLVTYRAEFATLIERGGGRVTALLDELRRRVAAERRQVAS